MKKLRCLVAAVLLLSALFALSSCGNTTLKNDIDVRKLWKENVLDYKAATLLYINDYQNVNSHAYAFTKIKDECLDDAIKLIRSLGEASCTKIEKSDLAGHNFDKCCLISIPVNDGVFSIYLYDGYLSVNNEFYFQIDYDRDYIVKQLDSMAQPKMQLE